MRTHRLDLVATTAGAARMASGLSVLADPISAHRVWVNQDEPAPQTRVLLRSMGYRDALIGALLMFAGLRGRRTNTWFLASAGADAADLLGGWAVLDQLDSQQRKRGIGGAAFGLALGTWGATRRHRKRPTKKEPDGQSVNVG